MFIKLDLVIVEMVTNFLYACGYEHHRHLFNRFT